MDVIRNIIFKIISNTYYVNRINRRRTVVDMNKKRKTKKKESLFLCINCGLEFPESEFSSITEEGYDVCPACGQIKCFNKIEGQI